MFWRRPTQQMATFYADLFGEMHVLGCGVHKQIEAAGAFQGEKANIIAARYCGTRRVLDAKKTSSRYIHVEETPHEQCHRGNGGNRATYCRTKA